MARFWEGYEDDKPLWKERRGHLLQFPDHIAKEKENSSKNLIKSKEKERAKSQAVTNLPPLKEISSSRFGCSGNKYEYTAFKKPFPTRVSFFLY